MNLLRLYRAGSCRLLFDVRLHFPMSDSTPLNDAETEARALREKAANAAVLALLRRIALITPIVCLLAVAGLYGFLARIDSAALRSALAARATGVLGLRVRFESLSIQPFNGVVALKGVRVSSPEGFGESPVLSAPSAVFEVDLPALLMDGQLLLGKVALTNAKISLVHRRNPQTGQEEWNIDKLLPPQPEKPPASKPLKTFWVTDTQVRPEEIVFEGTRITIGTPDEKDPRRFREVKLTLTQPSITDPVSFATSGRIGGGGRFRAEGVVGPWTRPRGTALPLHAGVTVEALDLGRTGQRVAGDRIEASGWFLGTVDVTSAATALKGQVKVNSIKFGNQPRTSRINIATNVEVVGNHDTHVWTLGNSELRIGSSTATLQGSWTVENNLPNVLLNFKTDKFAVSDATEFIAPPDVQLGRTNGLQDGRAIGSMTVEGSLAAPTIKGEARVFSPKMTGIDLDASLGGTAILVGTTAATTLEGLKFSFQSAGSGITLDGIHLETPRYRMDGSGSMAADGRMHFVMSAAPVRPGQAKASFTLDGSFAQPELKLGAK